LVEHHIYCQYNAVKTALEQARELRAEDHEDHELTHIIINIKKHTLKSIKVNEFRTILTEEAQPCASNLCENKLNVDISSTDWESIFRSTQKPRLRVLQRKILRSIYPTNILLNKMGIANSDKCSACHSCDKGYTEHFFFACAIVKPTWILVEREPHFYYFIILLIVFTGIRP